ncbi:MAG: hypothetical protein ABJA78_17020 [Ferruginibacter sp.]
MKKIILTLGLLTCINLMYAQNVGIGILTPIGKLHVSGVGTAVGAPIYQAGIIADGATNASASGVYGEGGWRGVYGRNIGTSNGTEAIGVLGRLEGNLYTTGFAIKGEAAGTGPNNVAVAGIVTGAGIAGFFDGGAGGYGIIVPTGNVGIGTNAPTALLQVNGSFKLTNGTQAAGKILTSDINGVATWGTIVPGLAGTTNWIPKFTGANSIGNSALSQNPGNNRLCIDPAGPSSIAGLYISTADSFNLKVKQTSNANLFGGIRYEYAGAADVVNRVGIFATTIRTIADVNGIGIEGAGSQIGVWGYAQSVTGSQVEGLEGDSYASGTYSIAVAGFADRNGSIGATNCWGLMDMRRMELPIMRHTWTVM